MLVGLAGFEREICSRHGHDGRAGPPLQLGEPADVVVMLVARADQLHVGQFEAQALDIRGDRRRGFGRRGVEQDVTLGRRDQKRGDRAGADVVDIAENVQRRRGIAPPLLAGACRPPFGDQRRTGGRDGGGKGEATEHSSRR